MKNITFKDIKNRFPNISMEKGIAIYGVIALLKEKVDIRKVFAAQNIELDEETEDIIAMAKSILTSK